MAVVSLVDTDTAPWKHEGHPVNWLIYSYELGRWKPLPSRVLSSPANHWHWHKLLGHFLQSSETVQHIVRLLWLCPQVPFVTYLFWELSGPGECPPFSPPKFRTNWEAETGDRQLVMKVSPLLLIKLCWETWLRDGQKACLTFFLAKLSFLNVRPPGK